MDKIKNLLINLNLCSESSIQLYHPKVRDRSDISVLKCNNSGIIFLSSSDHVDQSHYTNKSGFDYWSSKDRNTVLQNCLSDTTRRTEFLKPYGVNKNWLDVGTGVGAILDSFSPLAKKTTSVEPQEQVRNHLIDLGYECFESINEVEDNIYDLVTLFHVFEHLTDPIEDLKQLHRKMTVGAKIILEVPHANDILLSLFDLECFKNFTFWSEHLILHTRQSLFSFLKYAGFDEIIIEGCQRYSLPNHLHWLSQNKPGGHEKWSFLMSDDLDKAYANKLASIDKTDTLIAVASKT